VVAQSKEAMKTANSIAKKHNPPPSPSVDTKNMDYNVKASKN